MDFSEQHFTDLIQDPVVIILLLVGLLFGFFLGWLTFRSRSGKPGEMTGRVPSTSVQTPAAPPRSDERPAAPPLQAPKPQPPVEKPHKIAPPTPQPVPVPVVPVVAVPMPTVPDAPPPTATEPERALTGNVEAQIRTRTGKNPGKEKLADPYADMERQWSAAETTQAIALYRSGKSIFQIARVVRIDQIQVATHLVRVLFHFKGEMNDLSSAPRNGKSYADEEISKMKSYFEAGVSIQDIATELERTVLGVGWRMLDRRMI